MREGLSQRLGEMRDRCSFLGQAGATQAALIAELRGLATCFDATLRDVSALRLPDTMGRHVPGATDELEAVVQHTAAATETILDQCEKLEAATADTSCSPAVSQAAMRIYEACSFQDIVGQRLAKVVRTLLSLEAKTAEILRVFGPMPDQPAPEPAVCLLEGPQMRLAGMDQHAVDALLESAR